MYTLSSNTLIESAKLNQNFTDLSTGAGDSTANSLTTWRDEGALDFIVSGGVWTADSVGVNKNASMTAMSIVINGRRIPISSVTARTFTASKDTYIDVLDNADGTGTLVYTEVTNNAASPALASNSVRVGIIITGATTIATTASVNQGQEDRVLPIASSIAYTVTDSLGNLICPRDPNRKILGYKQLTTGITTTATTATQLTGLSCPVIVPTGRKVKISVGLSAFYTNTNNRVIHLSIWSGTVGSGTQLADVAPNFSSTSGTQASLGAMSAVNTPSSASTTYNVGWHENAAGTMGFDAAATLPAFILVELAQDFA